MREQLDRDLLDIDTPEQARKTQGTTDTSTESSLDEIATEDVHQVSCHRNSRISKHCM